MAVCRNMRENKLFINYKIMREKFEIHSIEHNRKIFANIFLFFLWTARIIKIGFYFRNNYTQKERLFTYVNQQVNFIWYFIYSESVDQTIYMYCQILTLKRMIWNPLTKIAEMCILTRCAGICHIPQGYRGTGIWCIPWRQFKAGTTPW